MKPSTKSTNGSGAEKEVVDSVLPLIPLSRKRREFYFRARIAYVLESDCKNYTNNFIVQMEFDDPRMLIVS